jgi:pimeloyl-ACP methyl ester carboxylesterase
MKWCLAVVPVVMIASACGSNPNPVAADAAAAQSGLVDVSGGQLYYEVLGKGAPVILSHGGFGDRRMWDDQFAPLAQAFKVIRYDHRGFGMSPAADQAYSPVDDLVKLMDHLDLKRANLVGNSMGGTLALDFALLQPMRTGAVVVIASTAAGYPTPEEDQRSAETVMTTARRDGTGAAVELWLQHPMVHVTANHPGGGPRLRTMMQDNQRLFLNEHWPSEPVSPPTYQRLVELKANVLFIVGDKDVAWIRDGAAASADKIKGAKVETIAGADHLPQMVAPEKVNKLLVDYISLNGC